MPAIKPTPPFFFFRKEKVQVAQKEKGISEKGLIYACN